VAIRKKQEKTTGRARSLTRYSKYGKRRRTEPEQRIFGSTDTECCTKSATALHFSATLVNNSISLKIVQCNQESIRLIVDTGSGVNITKLSELRKEVLVDENIIFELKSINLQPVFTIESVILRVEKTVKFQVVYDNFPISEAGILGSPFFRENGNNINFRTSKL